MLAFGLKGMEHIGEPRHKPDIIVLDGDYSIQRNPR
jgi:hypothetical protein